MKKLALSLSDFKRIRDYIHSKTGLYFGNHKRYYFDKRIVKRIYEKGFYTFEDYFKFLKKKENNEEEILTNQLTINESYFFREYDQLKCLAEEVIPKYPQDYQFKVWSAGTSTGEEAYTLAIIFEEMLDLQKAHYNIIGTDIDTDVLRKATKGVYNLRSIKRVPHLYLKQYFHAAGNKWHIKRAIKEKITFYPLNFCSCYAMDKMKGFDIIFCRNVIIYFDRATTGQIIEHFYSALNKGGYLFLGHSETLRGISDQFKTVKGINSFIYQK